MNLKFPLASLALLLLPSAWCRVLGRPESSENATDWILTGTATVQGVKQPFHFRFSSSHQWRMSTEGALIGDDGFDGARYWTTNLTGVSHPADFEAMEFNELQTSVLMGVPTTEPTSDLRLRETFAIERDRDGHTKAIYFGTGSAKEPSTFGGWKAFDKQVFPTDLHLRIGHLFAIVQIEDAKRVADDPTDFSMPTLHMDWNKELETDLHLTRIGFAYQGGDGMYFFIKPYVDGKPAGNFLFDTGYDSLVIDAALAKDLALKPLVTGTNEGVVAQQAVGFSAGDSFQYGRVEILKPLFSTLDLSFINNVFNLKVSGICGNDFFSRVIVDVNPSTGDMKVLPPDTEISLDRITWYPIRFNGDTPCILCKFEDHDGYFSIDTGSNATVVLSPAAISEYNLLKGRRTSGASTSGVGGSSQSRLGTLSYFELGGHRFNEQPVGFDVGKDGAYASPYLSGSIGMGLLKKFRLILDYPHQRIGFREY